MLIFLIAMVNYYRTADDEADENAEKSVSISSFLNGPFDTPKQNPKRGSNDLRPFKPGKLGKSFQYLAVGLCQPDRSLLQVGSIPHSNSGDAIRMPNCVARVWRDGESGTKLGYGMSKVRSKHHPRPYPS